MNFNKINKLTFAQSIQRLEEIINNLESGNVELESAIDLYSEGMSLQEHCKGKLNNAKIKISQIVQNKNKIEKRDIEIEKFSI